MEPLYDTSGLDEEFRQYEEEFASDKQLQAQKYKEDLGFFETVGDIAMAPVRGVMGAAEGVYGLVDAVLGDILPDAPENFGLGGSKSFGGGVVETVFQFGAGFLPGLGIASHLGKVGKIGKAVEAGNKTVASLQAAGRNVPALFLARGMEAGKYAVGGAIADFTVFDGHEQRLSNFIQSMPELENPITEFLAANEEDDELVGRLKAALEGAGIGVAIDAVLIGLRAFRAGVKAMPDKKAATVALEQKQKELMEQKAKEAAQEAAAKEADDAAAVTMPVEIDSDLPGMTKSQLRAEAKKHPGVKRNGKGVTSDTLQRDITEARRAPKDSSFFKDPDTFYRVVNGEKAFQDIVESGLVRARAHSIDPYARKPGLDLDNRPTGMPSFTKGKAHVATYAGGNDGAGRSASDHYVIVNSTFPMGPIKRGQPKTTMFPMADGRGQPSFSAKHVDVYKHVGDGKYKLVYQKGELLEGTASKVADQGEAATRGAAKDPTEAAQETAQKQADEAAPEKTEAAPEQTIDESTDELLDVSNGGGTLEMVKRNLDQRVNNAVEESEKRVADSSKRETKDVYDKEVAGQFQKDADQALEDAKLIDEATGSKLTVLETQIRNMGEVTGEARKALINNRYRLGAARELLDTVTKRLTTAASLAETGDYKQLAEFLLMQKNYKTLANNIRATQSEFGRNLQSIQRGTGDTTAGRAAREIPEQSPLDKFSIENLDQPEVVARILDIAGGAEAVRAEAKRFQATLKNGAPGSALKYARGKAGYMGAINEWWMNSILSGPTTMVVNGVGGLATTLLAPMERAMGQALAGNMRNAGVEMGRLLAMPGQIRDSLKAAKAATASGEGVLEKVGSRADDQAPTGGSQIEQLLTESRLTKNIDDENMGLIAAKWMARNVVNAPGKLLAGTDEFFKQLNYRTTIKAELYKKALDERVLRPDKIDEWVEQEFKYIVDDGQYLSSEKFVQEAKAKFHENDPHRPEKIHEYVSAKMARYSPIAEKALATARDVTFTTPLSKDRGMLSGVGKGLSDITGSYPPLRIVLPFVRTPTNVMQYVLNRVPVLGSGQGSAIQKRLGQMFADDRAALAGLEQEAQAEALGRLATGMTFFGGAAIAAMNGGITGGGPGNYRQRKLKEQTGWQPYSIKVGDSYLSYQRLDPIASFMGISADLVEIMSHGDEEQRKDAEDLAVGVAMAISKNITSKTYLKGIKDLTATLFEAEMHAASFFQRTAASFVVPNLFAQAARSGPDEMMDIKSLTDALKARIPGLSDSVPHRRNMLGEEIQDNGVHAAVDIINPFSYSTVRDDKMMQEFDQIGHGFSAPKSLKNGVELRDYKSENGQSAYDRWQELSSNFQINGKTLRQELKQLMSSSKYKRLPYEPVDGLDKSPRARLIQSVLNKYRSRAFAEMLDEFPEVSKRNKIVNMIKSRRKVGKDYQDLLALIED